MEQFNADLMRLTLFWGAAWVVSTALGMWALYLIIKAAVRDGMREAMGKGSVRRHVSNLPDMRAD